MSTAFSEILILRQARAKDGALEVDVPEDWLAEPGDDLPLAGWRLDSKLVLAHQGYTNQASILWTLQGQAMAPSRQCMLIFG